MNAHGFPDDAQHWEWLHARQWPVRIKLQLGAEQHSATSHANGPMRMSVPLLDLVDFLVVASPCYSWTSGTRSATTPRRRLAVSDNSIVSAWIDEFSNVEFTVSDAFRMLPVCVAAKTTYHAGAEHEVR